MRAAIALALVVLSALCALPAGTSPIGVAGRSLLLAPSRVWTPRAAPGASGDKEEESKKEEKADGDDEDVIHFPDEKESEERKKDEEEGEDEEEDGGEDGETTTEPQEDVSDFFVAHAFKGMSDNDINGAVTAKANKNKGKNKKKSKLW